MYVPLGDAIQSTASDIYLQTLETLHSFVQVADHLCRLSGLYETFKSLLIESGHIWVPIFHMHARVILLRLFAVTRGAEPLIILWSVLPVTRGTSWNSMIDFLLERCVSAVRTPACLPACQLFSDILRQEGPVHLPAQIIEYHLTE